MSSPASHLDQRAQGRTFYFMPPIPYNKPPLNYVDQLSKLKSRGLIVENEDKALHILQHVSYYRLSGYWHPMLSHPKTDHKFKPNSTFENAFSIYCFDRELRHMIVSELEKIEIAVRAKMSYILSHAHGPFWFTDSSIFKNAAKHAKSLERLKEEFDRSEEEFIKSFKFKYSDSFPPCWTILEIASFGSLSTIYSNLIRSSHKQQIANYFQMDEITFASWLHNLTYVRNLCAHHSRLWNKKMAVSPKDPLSPLSPFIKSTGATNKPIYFLLSMVVYLLNTINPKHTFKNRIFRLLKKYPMIHLGAMGFSPDWENEPLWNWEQIKKDESFFNRLLKNIGLKRK